MREKIISSIVIVLILAIFLIIGNQFFAFSLAVYGWTGASTISLLCLGVLLCGTAIFGVYKIWK